MEPSKQPMGGRRMPPGTRLLTALQKKRRTGTGTPPTEEEQLGLLNTHRVLVLLLTFFAYACYHASRKSPSIVKSVLDPPDVLTEPTAANHRRWPIGDVFLPVAANVNVAKGKKEGWAPFDGPDGTAKLGEIDLAFLASYSTGMYVAGHLGDRLDLRLFLAIGMVGSGCFVGLFGMGYFWGLHVFAYYLGVQMLAGLFQATGWPSVVAVVGNWFGKRKRGLIMGVWNAHTSVGNIGGSLLAASVLQYGWGWSFLLPGGLIAAGGVLVYLFLPAYPEDVGLPCPHGRQPRTEVVGASEEGNARGRNAVRLVEACKIPGVIPFALSLFFSKLVAYTFLYWLPFYLSQTEIGGEYMSVQSAGNLSTLFDVGGIFGGILAGYISDRLKARAITAASFMYLAIPSLHAYYNYGSSSRSMNIVLMMICGLFVNGPYALITTAVSADLGTHKSLKGDSRALATVTAIIDGTGSLGAALGPLLTGVLSSSGWGSVFLMLTFGSFLAGVLLSRLISTEIQQFSDRRREPSADNSDQQRVDGSVEEPLLRQEGSL